MKIEIDRAGFFAQTARFNFYAARTMPAFAHPEGKRWTVMREDTGTGRDTTLYMGPFVVCWSKRKQAVV